MNKRVNGQFYTTVNPFIYEAFTSWIKLIDNFNDETILEPFAGANNIVKMIDDLGYNNKWKCYDLFPNNNSSSFSKFIIEKRDVLYDYPQGYRIVITNPPYLSKSSASRNKIPFIYDKYDDLYKFCVETMLDNNDYVAAIIPESFITQDIFHRRLYSIISINTRMFDDTACPVCLSMFITEKKKDELQLDNNDFLLYKGNHFIGKFSDVTLELDKYTVNDANCNRWKFNAPDGEIGLFGADNCKTKSIKFVNGDKIDPKEITVSSRIITKIKGLPYTVNVDEFVSEANTNLNSLRSATHDTLLTSFKSLREDGEYRRRLDYRLARIILSYTLHYYLNK